MLHISPNRSLFLFATTPNIALGSPSYWLKYTGSEHQACAVFGGWRLVVSLGKLFLTPAAPELYN